MESRLKAGQKRDSNLKDKKGDKEERKSPEELLKQALRNYEIFKVMPEDMDILQQVRNLSPSLDGLAKWFNPDRGQKAGQRHQRP